jgi:hypothetical protein
MDLSFAVAVVFIVLLSSKDPIASSSRGVGGMCLG